jgi:proteic killer suppression protein
VAIVRFKHKGLRDLFENGASRHVAPALHAKSILILDLLNRARSPSVCRGSFDFHPLKGDRQGEWSMHVNGPWCITFEWDAQGDVTVNDLENYHGDD